VINRWKFTLLLVVLVALIVLHPMLDDSQSDRLIYGGHGDGRLHHVIVVLFHRPKSRFTAVVLGVPTLAGLLTNYVFALSSPVLTALLFHLLPIIFLGYTVVVILRTIFLKESISTDSINGAFCGYLLLGVAFAHCYSLIETFWPGSFQLPPAPHDLPVNMGQRHSALNYSVWSP